MNPYPMLKALLFKKTPVYAHYGVTHRCNLQCRMCGLWKTGDRQTEMTLPRIKKMAENFHSLGVSFLSIGGGEPFMRDDLPEILKTFMSYGINVRLLTNGIITKEKLLGDVLETGIHHVSISLDTSDPKKQAYICNREDAWERATETMKSFSRHFSQAGGIGIINTVVSRLNIDEIPDIIDIAAKLNFYCSFVPIEIHHYGGENLGCADTQADLNFREEDHPRIKSAYDLLIARKKEGKNIFNSTPFLTKSRDYLLGGKPRWRCLAGMLYFSVNPEGNFSLCHRFKGYKLEPEEIPADSGDFVSLFKSSSYFEECGKTINSCPGCMRPCWSEVSLAFTETTSFIEALKLQRKSRQKFVVPAQENEISQVNL